MKIILAGATGLIGRALVRRLRNDDHSLILLTRDRVKVERFGDPSLQFVEWDARTVGDWTHFVDGADAIVNLVGESLAAMRWSASQKARLISSRIDSTSVLREAIARARRKPEVLLNASAVGYYGDVREGDVVESSPPGNDFLATLCVRWEQAARESEKHGVRVVLLRSAVVLERNAGALAKMLIPFKLFVGGPLGSGGQWFPWIHIADEIEAIVFAMKNPAISGPVNLAAPEPATMRQFCSALGRAMGRPSWAPVPPTVLRMVLGEMSQILLTGQRVVPKKLQDAGFVFRYSKLDGALREILR